MFLPLYTKYTKNKFYVHLYQRKTREGRSIYVSEDAAAAVTCIHNLQSLFYLEAGQLNREWWYLEGCRGGYGDLALVPGVARLP